MNLLEFQKKFSDERVCLEYLEEMRWGNGRACPHCGSVATYKFKDGRLFKCKDKDCAKQFTAKVGTIFSDSKIPLYKWFTAIYLCTSLKKGISSTQLAKYIGVTQKTAWFMLQRIRYACERQGIFTGIVEADETYVGGRRSQSSVRDNKTPILGIAEKRGNVKVKAVNRANDSTVIPYLIKNLQPSTVLHTDMSKIYLNAKKEGFIHTTVNHGYKNYVAPDGTHTNNIEGFWSHLKRGINGIYHHVSPKHLDRYCKEYEYRYNTRKLTDIERFNNWFIGSSRRLSYKKLVQ